MIQTFEGSATIKKGNQDTIYSLQSPGSIRMQPIHHLEKDELNT